MNWQRIKGNWEQLKGDVKRHWGDLTDDDLEQIEGDRDVLIGRLRARYGKARDAIEREVDEWFGKLEGKFEEKLDETVEEEAGAR